MQKAVFGGIEVRMNTRRPRSEDILPLGSFMEPGWPSHKYVTALGAPTAEHIQLLDPKVPFNPQGTATHTELTCRSQTLAYLIQYQPNYTKTLNEKTSGDSQ